MSEGREITFHDQMLFVDKLIARCLMRDGCAADETTMVITKQDVLDLQALSRRLGRMSPHQDQIRDLVMARTS